MEIARQVATIRRSPQPSPKSDWEPEIQQRRTQDVTKPDHNATSQGKPKAKPMAIPTAKPKAEDNAKATIESILVALILAFIFRAYIVEAFVIPTGSMAPTLLGTHIRVDDPQTGYTFTVNPPRNQTNQLIFDTAVFCPMSQNTLTLPANQITRSGDRILVQKYIYALNTPNRWDVVVFKAPHQPQINYIKRLVALPNESVHIFDGNVYVSDATNDPEDLATYKIARKTNPQENRNWQRVQQSIWQPIYHSQYLPLDLEKAAADGWSLPWNALSGQWELDERRSYVFEPTEAGDTGRIRFDFNTMGDAFRRAVMFYPYNQLMSRDDTITPIEDIRLAVGIEPAEEPVTLTLETTARLGGDANFEQLIARIDTAGQVTLLAKPVNLTKAEQPERELASVALSPLEVGRTTDVELWYVDQEALVLVDGEAVLRYKVDLNLEQMSKLPEPAMLPSVGIEVDQAATLHRVELDRDLYYLSGGDVRGGLWRERGELRGNPAVRLLGDEFFVLGDNSPQSQDSRLWQWEPDSNFAHLLIERGYFDVDGRDHAGIVPRGLLIGRAFFVYFPAPQRFGGQINIPGYGEVIIPIPNFGDMRFIW